MFDTMTMVKTFGALCGSLLIFLLGGWFAESVLHPGGGHGGDHAQGYLIETASADAGAAKEEAVPVAELLAAADASKGEKVFKKCSACHSLEPGKNGTGPSLAGIVNRTAGSEGGFAYSGAFDGVVDAWTPEHLFEFLKKPASYAPGTSMGFNGLGKDKDRANLIAYLQGIGG